ncbi:strG [Symbiodinium natans]|uniref:StrG protein n=1 Tax=Symbiodinium natans TaxID=878477 RepID=A0A812LXV4_9DINO|nr:strG [Symbiodinium natans]
MAMEADTLALVQRVRSFQKVVVLWGGVVVRIDGPVVFALFILLSSLGENGRQGPSFIRTFFDQEACGELEEGLASWDSEESCRDPAVVLLPEVSADEVAAAEARLSLAASADGEALLESFPAQWRSLYSHPQKLRLPAPCFDFRSVVAELLECPPKLLEQVHEVPRSEDFQPCPPLQLGMTLAGLHGAKKSKDACRHRYRNHEAHARLQELYRRFVTEEVLPGLARAAGERVEGFAAAVQTEPVIRVVLPSAHAATKRHRDADYGHIPEELNFWLPLTNVSGCSSLFVESFPGRADFHAFEGGEGDLFRWWGNLCDHYTEANTSTTTRVSLDFRVVAGSFYAAAAAAGTVQKAEKQRRKNHGGSMALGSYYTWMQASLPAGE